MIRKTYNRPFFTSLRQTIRYYSCIPSRELNRLSLPKMSLTTRQPQDPLKPPRQAKVKRTASDEDAEEHINEETSLNALKRSKSLDTDEQKCRTNEACERSSLPRRRGSIVIADGRGAVEIIAAGGRRGGRRGGRSRRLR